MRFYTRQHRFHCGVDLHARSMYVCVLDQEGNVLVSKDIPAAPEPFLRLIAPYREDCAVAAECMFTWYWLADLCAREGLVFVLGHALYMRAIHGGKAKNDRIDAHKIAALLRGGMLPQAYVYPQAMRATRDLMRQRAELLAHITNTNHQYKLPALGVRPARPAERSAVAEHFAEASVRKSIEADLSLIDHYDQELPRLERHIESSAQGHDPLALAIVRTIHGMGVGPVDPLRDPGYRALCAGAGVPVVLPAGETHQGVRRQDPRALRQEDRQCTSQMGILRSRRWVPACQQSGPGIAPALDGQARQGKEPGDSIAAKLARAVDFMLKRGEAFDAECFFAH